LPGNNHGTSLQLLSERIQMSTDPSAAGQITWRVSSTCDSGACVMVAGHGDYVLVGNTSQPSGPINRYTKGEWREFLAGAKLGDFDDFG
jgi:predicted secreted Zn-dependent protease